MLLDVKIIPAYTDLWKQLKHCIMHSRPIVAMARYKNNRYELWLSTCLEVTSFHTFAVYTYLTSASFSNICFFKPILYFKSPKYCYHFNERP